VRRRFGLIVIGSTFAVLVAATPADAATTLLVNPFAQTATPKAVAVDPAGDVYIADSADNEVFKVTPAGASTVVASGLSAPSGVTVDPSTGDVYIADTGHYEVKQLTPGGAVSVVAGTGTAGAPTPGRATASALGGPSGLAVDGAGNLYIADGAGTSGNPYVEKVTPSGTLSIVAGSGTRGTPVAGRAAASPLRTPVGLAVDSAGDVFIADSTAQAIVKVTPAGALTVFAGRPGVAGQPTAGPATSSKLNGPTGLAISSSGILYIADAANNRLEQVTSTGALTGLAGTGTAGAPSYGAQPNLSPLNVPSGIAVTASGLFYVANAGRGTVDRIAPALPALAAAPAPTGTTTQGQTLTAVPGTWANAPTAYSYQWERCNTAGASCANVAGANSSSYTLTGNDAGATIRALVTATNVTGSSTVASNPTAVIIPQPPASTGAPTIAGTATNLQTLSASPGSWSNNPTRFSYVWEDCDASGADCTAISGATASTYTLALSDVGATLRVIVTAANSGGTGTATSAASAAISPALVPWANTPVPRLIATPTISGSRAVGAKLSCSTGTWSNGPTGFEYQWNRGNAPIANATVGTYTVTTADRGHQLSCTVTAINTGGAIQTDSARVTIPAPTKTAAKRTARTDKDRQALTHRPKGGKAKGSKAKRGRATAARKRRVTRPGRKGARSAARAR
jgi:sugar lactone lactonase YvrE